MRIEGEKNNFQGIEDFLGVKCSGAGVIWIRVCQNDSSSSIRGNSYDSPPLSPLLSEWPSSILS